MEVPTRGEEDETNQDDGKKGGGRRSQRGRHGQKGRDKRTEEGGKGMPTLCVAPMCTADSARWEAQRADPPDAHPRGGLPTATFAVRGPARLLRIGMPSRTMLSP